MLAAATGAREEKVRPDDFVLISLVEVSGGQEERAATLAYNGPSGAATSQVHQGKPLQAALMKLARASHWNRES